MIIKSLELADFRNYEHLEISFDKGTNILYGDNAQGKTNILEAIYVSATTKSHKGSKDKEIINFDKEEAHIRTYLEKDGVEQRVDMHLRKNKFLRRIYPLSRTVLQSADVLQIWSFASWIIFIFIT